MAGGLFFVDGVEGRSVMAVEDISDDGGAEARGAKADVDRQWQMMGLPPHNTSLD
jgi:hypothetical protein